MSSEELKPCLLCGKRPNLHGNFELGYLLAHDCRASQGERQSLVDAWNSANEPARAQHQRITAAMAADNARLTETLERWLELDKARSAERDALRAELAEVKEREAVPVAYLHTMHKELGQKLAVVSVSEHQPFGVCGENFDDAYTVTTEPLYTASPASPDVEGLVKALERFTSNSAAQANMPCECEEAEDALSTWRQAHTPSTLPASSAEE